MITLWNLRIGKAKTTIRFFRSGDTSSYEVVEKAGPLHVVRQPRPWSLTATFAERLKDFLVSLLPGNRPVGKQTCPAQPDVGPNW